MSSDRHIVAPLSKTEHSEIVAMAKRLGLREGKFAALVVLRAIHRGSMKGLRVGRAVPEEETIVVRLPTPAEHDFIVERAEALEIAARQLVAHLLIEEVKKKWFIGNILGKNPESQRLG